MIDKNASKKAFKIVSDWVCKQTTERKYSSEELDSLSVALRTLKQALESEDAK